MLGIFKVVNVTFAVVLIVL